MRILQNWIDSYVSWTDNIESPESFRQWAAIYAIGKTLDQKVWFDVGTKVFPNQPMTFVDLPGHSRRDTITVKTKNLLKCVGVDTVTDLTSASPQELNTDGRSLIIRNNSSPRRLKPLPTPDDNVLKDRLIADLRIIAALNGPFKCTNEFLNLYSSWYTSEAQKRAVHFFRLAMCFNASYTDTMTLCLVDAEQTIRILMSLDYLLEFENE